MQQSTDIQKIREQHQVWRTQYPVVPRQNAARRATERLINSALFIKSQHIACYMSVRNELATQMLIEAIWQAAKQCYLPALDPIRAFYMNFYRYNPGDKLINNAFSIPEPSQTIIMPPWALQLVIMPLVAFDTDGNRLGTGCGYYDRIFANHNHWPQSPILCGFAYHQQQVPALPVRPWDVAMDYTVTDQALLRACV